MANIVLKVICSLSALFGVFTLIFTWAAVSQGLFESFSEGTVALKVSATLIRAIFLFLCAWAAWRQPQFASWFAWGAFATFVVGGAVDEVYRLGLIGGLGNLIGTYYVMSAVHAIFAITVWFLANKKSEGLLGR